MKGEPTANYFRLKTWKPSGNVVEIEGEMDGDVQFALEVIGMCSGKGDGLMAEAVRTFVAEMKRLSAEEDTSATSVRGRLPKLMKEISESEPVEAPPAVLDEATIVQPDDEYFSNASQTWKRVLFQWCGRTVLSVRKEVGALEVRRGDQG